VYGWWSGAKLEERRHLFDGIGAHGVAEAIPPNWGVQLADSGESIGEIARLHARIAALEAEVRDRDCAIRSLKRWLGADSDADLDIPPRREAA
jgi:hypothetical protein